MTTTQTVPVALGERSYDIRVGPHLIENAGAEIGPVLRGNKVFVITDSTVSGHWLDPLTLSLRASGIAATVIAVPPGEGSKSFADYEHVVTRMLEEGVDRRTAVVALGGGVVGDLAGFCAASVLRGLDFIQIPTTLLAQVDSSVGGKTGINTAQGKNLVGAFHQPRLVLADTGTLDTLPRREVLAGYAEVVKYGLIRDAGFFEWLERHGADLIAGDEAARITAVVESCKAKAAVVAADEREAGLRELLNFGHTFGHALEAAAGYDGTLLHGEAVSVGMVQALELSRRLGFCMGQEAERARSHLSAMGLMARVADIPGASKWQADELLASMRRDKKARDGNIRFVLARAIGDAFTSDEVAPDIVRSMLEEDLSATAGA
ncbi:3-dehydroquinate synthase [Nisaea acidiphila]|uniref:3-dehydroquinate synthase n=1 Tax=Nisaea acidiphila TaxID=1862145 RepID=A0A9J7AZ21_9PROT|nr:3-dehydroquinate synthase [Nisaea acidiphila]UUX51681.1 3-dehydroquinate synthase [Nisaea acidiphila]